MLDTHSRSIPSNLVPRMLLQALHSLLERRGMYLQVLARVSLTIFYNEATYTVCAKHGLHVL